MTNRFSHEKLILEGIGGQIPPPPLYGMLYFFKSGASQLGVVLVYILF